MMNPNVNILLCFLTAVIGVVTISLVKRPGSKILLLISTFWLSRILAARAWSQISGSIFLVSTDLAFWLFLVTTFFSMSVVLIVPTQLSIGQGWSVLGWRFDNWRRQLPGVALAFLLLGLVLLAALLRGADPGRFLASAFFSFLIASWQEEVIFRGQLMSYLQQKGWPMALNILGQAVVFCVVHIGFAPAETLPYFLPSAFVLGLIFGVVRWATGGQASGFLLHSLLNLLSLG
ncbi:MAG: CPBP family intramembrane metalloprotease [Anaerolineales bacterium]|nr:CPBP family intramembrane metalloprotease [Anaerolineales bacterium]MCB0027786.1 CPBP family intramembrane metalloprotease [Anaerolineales bacterium]